MQENSNCTLMIRHLSNELSKSEKVDFFKYFGAVDVKCLESKNKKSGLVFARFESKMIAEGVMRRLHQVEVLGQLISVEFARNLELTKNISSVRDSGIEVKEERTTERKYYEHFLHKLNSWTSGLDLEQPPPVHLRYLYPPPTAEVLRNIVKAIAKVPKLYTQVLHLMNRMNLPCPFARDFPIECELFEKEEKPEEPVETGEDRSEEESELESEGESTPKELIPLKRVGPRPANKKVKRPKLIKPVQTAPKPSTILRPDEVFETSRKEPQVNKKIEVKVVAELGKQDREEVVEAVGFEKIEPIQKPEPVTNEPVVREEETVDSVISLQELESNRISTKDQRLLPVFKNYQAGVASCRLYIKNLAKTVVAKDLHYIYRRYFLPDQDEQGTMFDVRLMQEGRMKGQAFVTLQNVTQAQQALTETNGYILKSKPMVVQFAHSSKPK